MSAPAMPRALSRLEAELVEAHRSLARRRRRRAGAIALVAAFLLAAGTAVAAIALLDDAPVQVPGAPVALPGAVRAQVDESTLRFVAEVGGRAYFTAEGATPGTTCLLAAPTRFSLVSAIACDPIDVVQRRGLLLSQTAPDGSRRVGVLVGVDPARVAIAGARRWAVGGRIASFSVGADGATVTITTKDPAWRATYRFPDTSRFDRLADPSRNPVITVTTPGGTRIP